MSKTACKKMIIKLMVAAKQGRLDVFNRLLLKCEKDVLNMQRKHGGKTLLIVASQYGNLVVVNRLLACEEIDVNLKDVNGFTALMHASLNEHLDVVNRLTDFQKMQIREGFEFSETHDSLYIPVDLIELITEFVV